MDFTYLFLQMLFALVIVSVAAVLILRYVLPKLSWARKFQKTGNFELIDRFGLDFRRAIYLVRVGKKYLVLGGSESGLHCLSELKPDELERIKGETRISQ